MLSLKKLTNRLETPDYSKRFYLPTTIYPIRTLHPSSVAHTACRRYISIISAEHSVHAVHAIHNAQADINTHDDGMSNLKLCAKMSEQGRNS
jgi:hypothetical protein